MRGDVRVERKKRRGVEIPRELQQELVRGLQSYLERSFSGGAVAVVYPQGASEPADNETVARLDGQTVHDIAWQIFGRRVRGAQVAAIAWGVLGTLDYRIREQYGLPLRKREVTKWLWRLGQDD